MASAAQTICKRGPRPDRWSWSWIALSIGHGEVTLDNATIDSPPPRCVAVPTTRSGMERTERLRKRMTWPTRVSIINI